MNLSLRALTAQALVPEHLTDYVRAVSHSQPLWCHDCLAWKNNATLVLVGYAPDALRTSPAPDPVSAWDATWDATWDASLSEAIQAAIAHDIQNITVLAPFRPSVAPPQAVTHTDAYWGLELPATAPDGRYPNPKLRNMLCRAARDVRVQVEDWAPDHATLVNETIRIRPFAPGTRYIFQHLEAYTKGTGVLFAARSPDGTLQGFSIGDYSAFATAFFMFAFRSPKSPPGTADLLLSALVKEADARGHTRVNLGLGINTGIAFFKKKWRATPLLPYCETSWNTSKSLWQRLWRRTPA